MKQASLVRTVTLLVLGVTLLAAFGQEQGALAQGPDKSTPSGKIDSALANILKKAEQGGVSAQGLRPEANEVGVPIEGNAVRVVVEVSRDVGGLVNAISRIMGGQFVQAQSQNFIELRIPLDSGPLNALLRLANLAGVGYIRPPLAPQALTVSQGVALTGADQLQSQGTRGQNTTIAVIDLGFAGLSAAQSRGELPSNVQTIDFSGSGLQSSSSHGTASAEVIHDMAPDANLVLMKVADEVDLENAVDRAIQMGVDVVNHSVAWFNTNFYDGTGLINDAVRRARNSGIVWVNAAGNYGRRHWQGVARDTNGNSWAEFSSGREGLSFSAQSGQLIEVYLTWRDWPTTRQDYDLYVTNSRGSIVASSTRVQNGSQPPTEHLLFSAPSAGDYEIRVRPASVGSAKQLAIFNLNQRISPFVKEGSIVTPADCSCALAVGAVDYQNWTTGPIAPFSSQGPTTDGRVKPDLVGPAGVQVTTSQWNPFKGTSAAAPHVAGAAALMLSQNPGFGAGDLERKLENQAVSMGASTKFGSGRLALTPSTPQLADLTIRNANVSPNNPRVGDTVTVSAEVVNQGSARAGSFSVELDDNGSTRTQQISGLAPGASASISFTRTINQTNTNARLTVDPFDQVEESDEGNNSTSLTINAQSQRPSLSIDVSTDRSSYTVGDEIRVRFNTNQDGHVYLYNVDAQGSVQILYPRTESSDASLQAGSYDLTNLLGAGRLTITGPTGIEDVHAILASRSVNLGIDGTQRSSYDDPNTFRSVLSNRINNQFPTPDWAWDVASFQVNRSQPSNRAPTARFSYIPNQPFVGDVVTFDASNSSDRDGRIVDWSWRFETNSRRANASGERVNVRFTSPGTVRVTLTVTDNQGATDATTQQINVRRQSQQRPPTARFSVNPSNPQVNQTVTFDGRNSSDPDGIINTYRWDFDGNGTTDATGPRVQTSYGRSGTF
ncbi:MAG: S8 family serine peptidase, partial [Candidatus Bipolaricaulia bacterium]